MEQELNFTLQIILFALTGLTGIAVLIFALRKKDNTPFDWEAFERTVKLMHDQTDANLDMLTKMNKQKDKIEEKIKAKKKTLGMGLVCKKQYKKDKN